jgi:hypothetical protein
MADNHKEIDRFSVVNRVLEPRLLDQVGCFDDLGDIAVTSEVKEYAKGHDAQSLFGCEIAVFRSNVLKLLGGWIHNLHITRNVFVAVHFREVAEGFVRNLG